MTRQVQRKKPDTAQLAESTKKEYLCTVWNTLKTENEKDTNLLSNIFNSSWNALTVELYSSTNNLRSSTFERLTEPIHNVGTKR